MKIAMVSKKKSYDFDDDEKELGQITSRLRQSSLEILSVTLRTT